jgi:phytoene synthase
MNAPAIEIERAYERCEEITRQAAANFYYGIRLLPRSKRQAMSAVYAFARRVDDIGDGQLLERDEQMAALADERRRLGVLANSNGDGWGEVTLVLGDGEIDPVILALSHSRRHYDLPLEALELLIDGVELDVLGSRYETFDELVGYCRAVAGSIGRLCLAIFTDGQANGAASLADELGVAMQLTNILRDIREDHSRGRVYLPAEDLRRFGLDISLADLSEERVAPLISFEAARAREWFDSGMRLVEQLDARSAACVLAMTGIYRSILERIEREPAQVLRERISLRPWEKTWVAARSLVGAKAAAGVAVGAAGGGR